MKKKNQVVKEILNITLIIFCAILVSASSFIRKIYPSVRFEELIFYLFNGVKSTDTSLIIMGVKYSLPIIIIVSLFTYFILKKMYLSNMILKKINKLEYLKGVKIVLSSLILVISIFILMDNLNMFTYIENQINSSNFIEENYVNPKDIELSFPEDKRNLIIIFVESLESSMFTKKQGGYWDYELVPELYELLNDKDTTTFYGNNKRELMHQLDLPSWTTGGDIAHTSALPFKFVISNSKFNSSNFMNGAYTLGDALKDNGYYNEYISSARTTFGGLNDYFTLHGNYNIIDSDSYSNYNIKLNDNNLSDWGFNDQFLFELAKNRLEVISKNNQPFNLALQTIDTHYIDGYIGWYSTDKYKSQYENVYATESKLIYDFIKWIKNQDFYKNTTIVIVGDHISMQSDFFKKRGASISDRYIYNCYINPIKKGENIQNRIYTSVDTYPTILASLGVNIKGDRLGLGVNLFSNEKSLSEKYGFNKFNKELNKKSDFYNKYILK